jgi:LPPG:FO 2-phospho-L-lactate transferase
MGMIAALAGGVGAARLLRGVTRVVPERDITVVVNTGDDTVLHGLHVSPDLDTVTYSLAGVVNPETGWGLAGETWAVMDALERYGGATWFRLGDRDLATHLYRTQRLRDGAPLSAITSEVATSWGVGPRLIPMSDDPVRTRVTLAGDGGPGGRPEDTAGPGGRPEDTAGPGGRPEDREVEFQDYFVRRRHAVEVEAVRFEGAESARPAPGVLEAIETATTVVVCPSNPIVSIGPILAVPGIEEAIARRRADTVAVSPIVAGAAIKGPADRLLTELGHEASVVGVARLYAPLVSTLVVDEADAALADRVEGEGLRCVVAPAVMSSPELAVALAKVVLAGGEAANDP